MPRAPYHTSLSPTKVSTLLMQGKGSLLQVEVPISEHPDFHKPSLPGAKSMADYWDHQSQSFTIQAPPEMHGLKTFLAIVFVSNEDALISRS